MLADWFNFALYALSQIVTTVFQLDLGLGFSLGDFEVALMIIGLIASAFVIRFSYGVATSIANRPQSTDSRMDELYGKDR